MKYPNGVKKRSGIASRNAMTKIGHPHCANFTAALRLKGMSELGVTIRRGIYKAGEASSWAGILSLVVSNLDVAT
jgi:hypothetical protein